MNDYSAGKCIPGAVLNLGAHAAALDNPTIWTTFLQNGGIAAIYWNEIPTTLITGTMGFALVFEGQSAHDSSWSEVYRLESWAMQSSQPRQFGLPLYLTFPTPLVLVDRSGDEVSPATRKKPALRVRSEFLTRTDAWADDWFAEIHIFTV